KTWRDGIVRSAHLLSLPEGCDDHAEPGISQPTLPVDESSRKTRTSAHNNVLSRAPNVVIGSADGRYRFARRYPVTGQAGSGRRPERGRVGRMRSSSMLGRFPALPQN